MLTVHRMSPGQPQLLPHYSSSSLAGHSCSVVTCLSMHSGSFTAHTPYPNSGGTVAWQQFLISEGTTAPLSRTHLLSTAASVHIAPSIIHNSPLPQLFCDLLARDHGTYVQSDMYNAECSVRYRWSYDEVKKEKETSECEKNISKKEKKSICEIVFSQV